MSDRVRLTFVLLAAWAFVVLVLAGTVLLVLADVAPGERDTIAAIALERAPAALILVTLLFVPAAFVLQALHARYVKAARQLSEDARVMLAANPAHRASPRGAREIARLAHDLNDLAAAREALEHDVAGRVREASVRLEQERNRLAALMSELAQSVIVCNIEGRILLYNARTMLLLRTASSRDAVDAGTLVGLGRSVFALFDRGLIDHALDTVRERLRNGSDDPVATFIAAAPAGQLLRLHLAPVRGSTAEGDPDESLAGFVLLLDDVTRRFDAEQRRATLLQTLTQGTRASLASIRAAAETIASFPDMDRESQARFVGVIGEEARRLTTRLDETVAQFGDVLRNDWPLEDMRGADLVATACRRIETHSALLTKTESIDETIWLRVDSYSLLQALSYLARRLRDDFAIREVRFNLTAVEGLAYLDLVWTGAPLGTETTIAWQAEPLQHGGEASSATLRDIVERHNGEVWYQIDKASHRECFRIALPLSTVRAAAAARAPSFGSRPEFYDFDLFAPSKHTPELDAQPLATLHFTVFDTETTGLDPAGGDEIVSIGAVRIVNGRLLRHEMFEQLVDPRRPMSPEARAITGLDDAVLVSQPPITDVLPAFARFCADTVLVAHNAAFDLRFLGLKERSTGVRFGQPVLDTMLLSAVLHPNLAANQLEAIAARMGVSVAGRHTALGDALMTAEVFLRMIPLLAERGIRTLGEARAASQRTYLARLEY